MLTRTRIFSRFLRFEEKAVHIKRKATTASSVQLRSSGLDALPRDVRQYVEDKALLCQPERVHVCDGSEAENESFLQQLQAQGMLSKLSQYHNCYVARTDPADVARVESKTFMSTPDRRQTLAPTVEGVAPLLGNWVSPADLQSMCERRYPACMRGRTMYVVPFLMGPPGSPLSKVGIELTDSAYVACCMRIMTRMGSVALSELNNRAEFVRCLHSVGQPLPMKKAAISNWPCRPEEVMVAHVPAQDEILSFGSGYGGNSLLGKKCLALRLGSVLAQRQGWLAEHMLILGLTNPAGEKRYVAAAFPSACGKTNLAMLSPTLPGWKAECVGDDIAWMKFDERGQLRAVNPEYGFFGVAPGTSMKTNPNALKTCLSNSLFTNVASTEDGHFYWEGLSGKVPSSPVTDWRGAPWTPDGGSPAAHPNSRFCSPASQCPVIDPQWESPEGVPIDAIIFGGRRPEGVPLVYESFDWDHGVFIGSSLRSEATAAAEFKGKAVMHDPFAMRPFFGYNFGHYLQHWLSMQQQPGVRLPKVFHVNWFRKGEEGEFLWPGFGDNVRVLDWILRRVVGEDSAVRSPIGLLPTPDALDLNGMSGHVDLRQLFDVPRTFWQDEAQQIRRFYADHVGDDLPPQIEAQLNALEQRLKQD